MPDVTYLAADGQATVIDVPAGSSLMLAAVFSDIRGIEGQCGGCLSCATCHVYVDEAFVARLPAPRADELAMLAQVAAPRRPNSRLSCQIEMTDTLDGLVLHMPAEQ